ncbi:hypothetical protein [Paramagnetospirillum marisnigri]|uniref:hypothetical protein n=1 Tax=Paramagnetospirillum marisnigri TaxID=1285242 RepID=UPI00155FFA44|nr:hypothetical protein [Paramagnetospirillum marisnigri]
MTLPAIDNLPQIHPDEILQGELEALSMSPESFGNPPRFFRGFEHRTHAASFSFWAGVMPPMAILGLSLLSVHGQSVA